MEVATTAKFQVLSCCRGLPVGCRREKKREEEGGRKSKSVMLDVDAIKWLVSRWRGKWAFKGRSLSRVKGWVGAKRLSTVAEMFPGARCREM